MNDIARIASLDYVPTDRELFFIPSASMPFFFSLIQTKGDIIKARIRTTGVEEHKFVAEKGDIDIKY
jgi:hypothetical protein